ncbi:MAG: uroporphyrinogen-III C-methyltransferase [Clostridiales bacterium]|nr:uroporphyrinogen-III C-methyltransferase [Clostridiales bacterium]
MSRISNTETGKIWLVGAGPGDPGLMTLRGRQVLQEADAVLCDALVSKDIIALIPPSAKIIYVGKRSGNHSIPQEEINRLLTDLSLAGKRVVRLKGGDPFLFGRGGEELELPAKLGIPFEVVPGVTSALAVPAYQGIPVTHRDFCSSVHIITGHRRDTFDNIIDYEALIRAGGTLIFLMGVSALSDICSGLLKAGMDPNMPAALLMRGTTPDQRRIVATVRTLEEEVQQQGVETPAIIVVGNVCSLAKDFSWYGRYSFADNVSRDNPLSPADIFSRCDTMAATDNRMQNDTSDSAQPLQGLHILLTRPSALIDQTADKLRTLGAQVTEYPTIRTVRREHNSALYRALQNLNHYQWLVFTSPTGVRIFFEEFQRQQIDIRKLSGIRIAAMGSGTQKELACHGLYADLVPEIYDGKHLGIALAKAGKTGDHILIPRASSGSPELADALSKMQTDDIPTYDTVLAPPNSLPRRLCAELKNGAIDYILFTSASCVRGFAAAVGTANGINYSMLKAVCIGKQTQQEADALGMTTWVAEQACIDSLIDCLTFIHEQQ